MKLNYGPYSYSSINTYKLCPKQFKYKYVDRIKSSFKATKESEFGLLFHLITEYKGGIQKIKKSKKFLSIKENKILKKEDVKKAFDFYKKYTESKIGNLLENKFNTMFFEYPIGMNIDDEKNILIPLDFWDKNVNYRGYIDSLKNDEKILYLIDYKTGKLPDLEKMKKDNRYVNEIFSQLLYYGASLFEIIPPKEEGGFDEIKMIYVYVNDEGITPISRSIKREEKENIVSSLKRRIKSIDSSTYFPETDNEKVCEYCAYKEMCKGA